MQDALHPPAHPPEQPPLHPEVQLVEQPVEQLLEQLPLQPLEQPPEHVPEQVVEQLEAQDVQELVPPPEPELVEFFCVFDFEDSLSVMHPDRSTIALAVAKAGTKSFKNARRFIPSGLEPRSSCMDFL